MVIEFGQFLLSAETCTIMAGVTFAENITSESAAMLSSAASVGASLTPSSLMKMAKKSLIPGPIPTHHCRNYMTLQVLY